MTKYLCLVPLVVLFACVSKPVISSANQNWLNAAQHVAVVNHDTVSTPSKERAQLFTSWAKQNGYAVQTTKSESGFYRIVASK